MNARSGPYELQAAGENENLIEKVNRLKCEVADLEDELAKQNVIQFCPFFFTIQAYTTPIYIYLFY